MSLCINPNCSQPQNPDNQLFCQNCGSELLLSGRYQVIRLLSDKGGFGRTYEAVRDQTPKVLKVLIKNHPKVVQLFEQEARILSCLSHPGIPQGEGYFNFFPRDSSTPLHCLAMQKIEGLDLEEYIQNRQLRPIDQQLAVGWLKQLTEILACVHQQNFFHRDIKPSNIILQPTGQLALIDFGAVRQVTDTIISGRSNTGIYTLGYAPPEQEKGYAVPQSDFYALGRTMVYLLTGKNPNDPEIYDHYNNSLRWQHLVPDLNPNLARLIEDMTQERVSARPPDTGAILQRLEQLDRSDKAAYTTTPPSNQFPDTVVSAAPPAPATEIKPPPPSESHPTSRRNNNHSPISRRLWLQIAGGAAVGFLGVAVTRLFSGSNSNFSNDNRLLVSSQSDGDYQSITEAINNASVGSQIVVLPGTYQESLTISQNVEIVGEGDRANIIIETPQSTCITMQAEEAVIRGLTIRCSDQTERFFALNAPRGKLLVEDCVLSSSSAATFNLHGSGTEVTVRNSSIGDGKIGFQLYEQAQVMVEDCDIFNHQFSQVIVESNAQLHIRNCQIRDSQEAGILFRNEGQGTVENCQIYNNSLSAIDIRERSNPRIDNCELYNNQGAGILIYEEGLGEISNCDIYDNSFSGIEIREGANPSIDNCEVYNHADNNGFLVQSNGMGTISNCEIYQNGFSGVEVREGGNPTFTGCQINQNNDYGVYVHTNGRGTFTNCSFSANGRGAWLIDETSQVERSDNTV